MPKIRAKKSLGQNFLIDQNISKKIITASNLTRSDVVLEVGAGKGALTGPLLETGARVFSVEIDKRLHPILNSKFSSLSNFSLLAQDILKLDLCQLKLKKKIKLIGNLPFYISSQIIAKFLPLTDYVDCLYVTVQKELAQRIVSRATRESSAFSLYVEFFSRAKILFPIKRTCFWPQPKVDVCFLELVLRCPREIDGSQREMLFKIIRRAFTHRRKTILGALRRTFDIRELSLALQRANIEARRRPETLTLDEYISLAHQFKL